MVDLILAFLLGGLAGGIVVSVFWVKCTDVASPDFWAGVFSSAERLDQAPRRRRDVLAAVEEGFTRRRQAPRDGDG